MVLCVDSMTDMEAAAALIRDSLAKGNSNGPHSKHCNLLRKIAGVSPQGELGVGIMCNWTCKDVRAVLEQQVGFWALGCPRLVGCCCPTRGMKSVSLAA